MKRTLAKSIRVISIPPIMISALILLLSIYRTDIFANTSEIITSIILLGIIPIFAYPFQYCFKSLKEKGRTIQRKLAFVFSILGYTSALLWALIQHVSKELLTICATYFLSVIILTFINKILKKKASGHACSVTGPLVFLVFLIDWKLIIPCVIFAFVIFWSSLYLKRHTKSDLAWGVAANLIAFALSYIIILL